jgi:hypothetical protein
MVRPSHLLTSSDPNRTHHITSPPTIITASPATAASSHTQNLIINVRKITNPRHLLLQSPRHPNTQPSSPCLPRRLPLIPLPRRPFAKRLSPTIQVKK